MCIQQKIPTAVHVARLHGTGIYTGIFRIRKFTLLKYYNNIIIKTKPNAVVTLKVFLSDCIFALFENKLSIFNTVNNVKFFKNN